MLNRKKSRFAPLKANPGIASEPQSNLSNEPGDQPKGERNETNDTPSAPEPSPVRNKEQRRRESIANWPTLQNPTQKAMPLWNGGQNFQIMDEIRKIQSHPYTGGTDFFRGRTSAW